MNQRVIGAFACFLASFSMAAETASRLSETRTALEKWVETKQLISTTRSDWQTDRETIEQTIKLFERELSGLEEQFGTLSTNNVLAEKERAEAEALLKESNDGLAPVQEFATTFEAQLRQLTARLPHPLQDILKPMLARLPEDAATTKMKVTERVQAIVAVLNELDKFNNSVSLFSERRTNAAGNEVSVETVYVGLAAAYFVNEAGDFAGVGVPGPAGWEWSAKPEIAARVREVIRIYRNERPARFVNLPAVIR